jgi:hypothetical protein
MNAQDATDLIDRVTQYVLDEAKANWAKPEWLAQCVLDEVKWREAMTRD